MGDGSQREARKRVVVRFDKSTGVIRSDFSQAVLLLDRMVACPAPAYVVGVDVNAIGVGFLLSINEPHDNVASLTTRFRIDCGVLERLRDEVTAFWSSRNMTLT